MINGQSHAAAQEGAQGIEELGELHPDGLAIRLEGLDLDVCVIDPRHVDQVWPIIEPYIQRGLDWGYDAYSAEDCLQRLRGTPEAQPTLIAVVLLEPGETEPVLVLTLEVYNNAQLGKVCHFVTAGGAGLETWKHQLHPIINHIAREQGATWLTTKGRKGWERALAPLGYVHHYTILGRPVT